MRKYTERKLASAIYLSRSIDETSSNSTGSLSRNQLKSGQVSSDRSVNATYLQFSSCGLYTIFAKKTISRCFAQISKRFLTSLEEIEID